MTFRGSRLSLTLLATSPAIAWAQLDAAAASAPQAQSAGGAEAATLPSVVVKGRRAEEGSLLQPSTAGSRLELTPLETPASVAVVPGETIRALGVATVLEAKTLAPGITSSNSVGNGGNLLNARGFSGQNSVKQLYNGLEMSNAGGVVSFPFDPWNVDRVEALNGPASVLYGTGAIGGAVNVVSKRAQPGVPRHEAAVGVGSYRSRHAAFASTGSLGTGEGDLSYRVDFSHRRADNWVERTPSETLAASASLRYDASADLRFVLSGDFGKQRPMHYLGTPVFNGAPAPGTERKNYNIADSDLFFQDQWLTLETDWTARPGVHVNNKTYAMEHSRRYRDVTVFTFQPATASQEAFVRRTSYRDIAHSLQKQVGTLTTVRFDGELGESKNELVAGFELNRSTYDRHDNVRGGSSDVDAYNPVPGSYRGAYQQESQPVYYMTLKQVGLFIEDRLSLSDKLSLVGGLRADQYRNERQDRLTAAVTDAQLDGVNGSLGAVYRWTPDTSLYGQVATASDPVNSLASIGANQQGFDLSDGRQIEIGVKQATPDGRLEWTLSAYHLVKKDVLTPSLSNPTVSEQVGQQSTRGLEASLATQLGDWRFVANGTVLKPRYDEFGAQVGSTVVSLAGKVPVNVHRRAANLLAFWKAAPGWTANAAWRYVGERFTNSTNTAAMPGYSTVDMGLSWAVTPSTLLDVRVENVFDKVYATQGSTTQWMLGRPRSVFLSARHAF